NEKMNMMREFDFSGSQKHRREPIRPSNGMASMMRNSRMVVTVVRTAAAPATDLVAVAAAAGRPGAAREGGPPRPAPGRAQEGHDDEQQPAQDAQRLGVVEAQPHVGPLQAVLVLHLPLARLVVLLLDRLQVVRRDFLQLIDFFEPVEDLFLARRPDARGGAWR